MYSSPFKHLGYTLLALSILPSVLIAAPAKWTILIYGHADHSLTSAMRSDLLEMEEAGSSENFKIAVQLDINSADRRTKFWKFKYNIDPKKFRGVKRMLISEDNNPSRFNSDIIESLPEEKNMDDPDVLSDFIQWGMTKYPADRYGLVLWNHGGQFVGYGGDSQEGSLNHPMGMTTDEVKKAIQAALSAKGQDKMDFIAFDTCLMGGAEILGDFSTFCDVFFACPELDYGDGWDYDKTLNYLKANPDVDIKEFARKEVEFWNTHHGAAMDMTHKVHAAYDMSKYESFSQRFKEFSVQLKLYGQTGGEEVPKIRAEATHYSVAQRSQAKSPTHFIDLGDFAKKFTIAPVNAELKKASFNLVQAIDEMILAKATGSLRTHISALSIAYPHNTANWIKNYEELYDAINFTKGIGKDWRIFLSLYGVMSAADEVGPILVPGSRSRSFSNTGRTVDDPDAIFGQASLQNPIDLDFSVSGKDVFELSATLVEPDNPEDPNEYIYIGEVGRFRVNQEGNHELTWPGTNAMITSTSVDYFLRLGGWFMGREGKQMISFADYQPPDSEEIIQLFLFTTIDEEGLGEIHTILEDSGQELPDGGAIAATPASSSLELEEDGKLWPVYYSEVWSEQEETWQSQYLKYQDGFVVLPKEGLKGIWVEFTQEFEGRYSMEFQASDFVGNFSEILEYNIEVPKERGNEQLPNQYVTTLQFTGLSPLYTGTDTEFPGWIFVEWDNEGAQGAALQQASKLEGPWQKVPDGFIETEDNVSFHWSETGGESQFFRLIKN
jgi:hypothetical protein